MAKCTVSIVSYNSQEVLEQCLSSIIANLPLELLIVKVVDNASWKIHWEQLIAKYPWVHFEKKENNIGFGLGHNYILGQVKTPYTLILNPDTEFIDQSLINAIDYLDQNPNIAGLSGKILNQNLQVLPSVYRFPQLRTLFLRRMPFISQKNPHYTYSHHQNKNTIHKVDWCSGALMLLRSKVLHDVEYFDHRYFMYFEDVDLCRKIQSSGHTILYYPFFRVIHHWKQESKKNIKLFYYLIRSMISYYNKWGWKI